MRLKIVLTFIFFVFLFNATSHLYAESVWRVDWESAAPLKDGKSWDTAFTTIQEGVDAAFNAGGGEVWVAEGTYKNDSSTSNPEVLMRDHVSLYGGFKGIGIGEYEQSREQRKWNKNITIIDGGGKYACVFGASDAVLDGFTITGGCGVYDDVGNCYGGGLYCKDVSNLLVQCCIIHGNEVDGKRGTDETDDQTGHHPPTDGKDARGGGVYLNNSTASFVNTIIDSNIAHGGYSGYSYQDKGVKGGSAYGAGLFADKVSFASFINCDVIWNESILGGGTATWGVNGVAKAGGLYINTSCVVTNCILAGNSPWSIEPHAAKITYTSIDPDTYSGSGVGVINANPLFTSHFRLSPDSPCIDTGTSYTAPSIDIAGNPRPLDIPGIGADGTGSEFDMGVIENQLTSLQIISPYGSITPPPGTYSYVSGAYVTVSREPDIWVVDSSSDVYVCQGWKGEGSVPAQGNYYTYTVTFQLDEPSTITWLWELSDEFYMLTVDTAPEDTGKVTTLYSYNPPPWIISANSEVTLTATATRRGYYFQRWSGDYNGTENPLKITVTGKTHLTAHFIEYEPPPSHIWFVDHESTATVKDGFMWDTAFDNIQAGIDAAWNGFGGDVWVAEGTYTVQSDSWRPVVSMKDGVKIYAGFVGIGAGGHEDFRDQRDWVRHPVIIDGETKHRCVDGATSSTLDGFTIANGIATEGGGIYCSSIDMFKIANCIFKNNHAWGPAGMDEYFFMYPMPPTAGGNGYGGGIYSENSSVAIVNCVFFSNEAQGGSGGHGYIFYHWNAPDGIGNGGAAFSDESSIMNITNSTFYGNSIIVTAGSIGGIYLNGESDVKNCIVWGNSGGNIYIYFASPYSVAWSDIEGGYAGEGNINAEPLFENPAGEDFHLQYGSPCIDTGTSVSISMDLDGYPRPADVPGVGTDGTGWEFDMGAFEFQPNYASASDTKNHILGRAPLPAFRKVYADHNGDGVVDVADIIFLMQQK
ncbi:MAG: right-handed parallel beta-helix repeat-containing protein [Candidatus Sumerlaeota bacterium]|nr:right-handed parallel beta-helix repeat-containing protein [Candidatus Sumerlaeota bacterium]